MTPPSRSAAIVLAAALSLGACSFPDTAFWKSGAPPADALVTAKPLAQPPAAATQASAPAHPAQPEERKPFIVIRFEHPDPDYGEALYAALSGALQRRPGVAFDLVAVTRDTGAAERNLADVMHIMAEMGMPADRLSLSAVAAADASTDEVWIYLR
jgi:hypothetical protein